MAPRNFINVESVSLTSSTRIVGDTATVGSR